MITHVMIHPTTTAVSSPPSIPETLPKAASQLLYIPEVVMPSLLVCFNEEVTSCFHYLQILWLVHV